MKNISTNIIAMFLKRNHIDWSGYVCTPELNLVKPNSLKDIIKNPNNKLDLMCQSIRTMFDFVITEDKFIIKHEERDINIDLSDEWIDLQTRLAVADVLTQGMF